VGVLFLAWLALMPLDAVRFGWSHLPRWLQWLGGLLSLISFALFFLTYRENTFLSPVVRLQRDRGQTVVSSGPYRYVRHPMYAAALVFLVGTTLLLGSAYGLILVLAIVLSIAVRAVKEEQTLLRELPGYKEYMRRVRYRMIPGVW
jgi:protein-S-isoprenylcysteine O-methyltransferase Ste14